MSAATGQTMAIRASEVIGRDVYNPSGENIGKVDDILLDNTTNGTIAVVRLGGAVTTSDDSYELPFSVLEFSGDLGGYFVPFTKEQIVSGAAASRSALDARR